MSRLNKYWLLNLTNNDLLLSDLNIKIGARQEADLFIINPSLTLERIFNSAKSGSIKKCLDFKKVINITKPKVIQYTYSQTINESIAPIFSRTKTAIIVDVHEHDHIEELSGAYKKADESKFVDYAEGFADPISEDSSISNIEAEVYVAAEPEKKPTILSDSRYFPVKILKNK